MPTKTRSTDKDLRVREIEELSRVLFDEHLAAIDEGTKVSWAQLRALSVLSKRGPLNLSGLAKWTQASLPSASRLVDRLEAGSLVERATHPTSRREIEIRLTATGRGVLNDVRNARRKRLRRVLAGMPAGDVSSLMAGLEGFARVADDAEA